MREILGKLGKQRGTAQPAGAACVRRDDGDDGDQHHDRRDQSHDQEHDEKRDQHDQRRDQGEGQRGEGGADRGADRGPALSKAALQAATEWGWPLVPGVELAPESGFCRCPRGEDCPVPGAHPHDPQLLAATRDPRMVSWWWDVRPGAPVLLATGGRAPCALSLPAVAGVWAMEELDRQGVRPGPVVATPSRLALLVQPYELPELGELLGARGGRVPGVLRFHGPGGYLPLPPSRTGQGAARWVRPPRPWQGRVSMPRAAWLLDVMIEAGISLGVLSEQQ